MPYVTIEARDGEFTVREMSDGQAASLSMQGGDPIYIEDDAYEAWLAHMHEHRAFNVIWRTLANEQGLRLRLREKTDECHRLQGIVDLARKVAEADEVKKTKKGPKK